MLISLIIPTYNPDLNKFSSVLNALRHQSLHISLWEIIIIDNNSTNSFQHQLDLSGFPNLKIVKEYHQGLTYARIKGFNEAKGDIIIMVDDDNILEANYLQIALNTFTAHPQLGCAGGKSLPEFECTPPHWLKEFYINLALRDLGDKEVINRWAKNYPTAAPIGAGMVIRKVALQSYINSITSGQNIIADRTATSLMSGGDNEIVVEILKSGWQAGYFPELVLWHIIPEERMKVDYLSKLIRNTNKSWVQLLEKHNINPWDNISKRTLAFRKLKAYFSYKPWKNEVNLIKWHGACGMFEGMVK
jgi:glycosyltransferase involved in cell wall biosynthesis